MLPSRNHLNDLFFGETALAKKLNKTCLLVDCSTISPFDTLHFGERLKSENGLEFVDAPVSGGVPGAENGTLTFMIGSKNEELFEVIDLNERNQKLFWNQWGRTL